VHRAFFQGGILEGRDWGRWKERKNLRNFHVAMFINTGDTSSINLGS